MEREILMGGIGGQGIQLSTKILAHAASEAGYNVMHFAVYGGAMRGGSSECTVIIGEDALRTPPIIQLCWCAIVMHARPLGAHGGTEELGKTLAQKVRANGILMVNTSVVKERLAREGILYVELPASEIAERVGHLQAVSMVALGALVELTKIVSMDSILKGVKALIPSYRQHMIDINFKCLEEGAAYVKKNIVAKSPLAWSGKR